LGFRVSGFPVFWWPNRLFIDLRVDGTGSFCKRGIVAGSAVLQSRTISPYFQYDVRHRAAS